MAIARSLLLIVLSFVGTPAFLVTYAQDGVNGQTPPVSAPPQVENSDPGSRKADVLLRTESGELIPYRELLGDRVIDELLQRGLEQRSVPRYTIARQEITGTVDRDEVTMTVRMEIQVHPEAEWVTIPLAFGEVFVTQFDHQSDVENSRAVLTSGEQNARQWHLLGSGLHTVTLELIGKARSLAPGVRQLNLNLPSSTASHANFQFTLPVELQSLPAGAVDKATKDSIGVRSVEFWGLAPTFSLSWSDVVQRVAQNPVIQVQNRMKLDLTTIPVNLTGTQQLQISGSSISEVRIAFPESFLLQEVDARNSNGISVLNNFEVTSMAGAVTALVRLTTAIEGSLTLTFDLELANRTFPQDIRVTLPAIQAANVQSGDLDILFPTGLLVQQTVVKGAQRKRVASETDSSVAATAFRMRSTESQVVLHVEETVAQFAVSPELTLQPDRQNVLLTARYPVSVLTGSLLDLSIVWPGYSSGEWQIWPGTARLISGKTSVPLSPQQSDSETDVLHVTFRERQSGEFIVEFRAYAPLDAVRSGAIQLHCPEIQGRSGQQFVLTTIESDEFSIRPISMGTGEPLPTVPLSVPASVVVGSGLKSESWLHDDASIPIRLELPEQAPSVRASIRVGMQPQGSAIEVRESIQFEIEHRDLNSLSLQVPTGIRRPTVRIAGQPDVLRATIEADTHWSFRLPEARRGNLAVEINYVWTPTSATDQMPLILPESAELLDIEAGTGSGSGITVRDDSLWQPVYSERFDAAWHCGTPTATVPVRWQRGVVPTPGDSPAVVLVRTRILENQILTTTLAIYQELPTVIIVETPLTETLDAILIDQESQISSEALQRGSVQRERVTERDVSRWQILKPTTGAASGPVASTPVGPHVVEFRTRGRLTPRSSLWLPATLKRAKMISESPAVPVIWCLGSQNDYRAASASSDFISLKQQKSGLLPWGSQGRSPSDRELKAILSPYPAELQLVAHDRLDGWLTPPDGTELFFGTADVEELRLTLVPSVALLLISATVCIVFFVFLSLLRNVTIIVPLLVFGCAALVAWLIFPAWTSLLTPYVAIGVLLGIVSVIFQRLISDRRMRFPKASQVGEYPTVFGYSGMMSHAVVERSEAASSASTTRSEFNVKSFV
ncbi:MAG TPA: hypothetical protein PK992_02260 [Planctomycetaceae bacterium]|nr:hypothetical protein [Planctomycetaceae bacterium]